MKKNKKLFPAILGILMAGSVMGIGNITKIASAEEAEVVLSVEDYTSSDNLIQANGIPSGKKIQAFSDEVKNALSGADCSEITQVIPRQYMESTETNAVYQYNGEEYGFYMVKEGNYFDLLLIDFVYEFNDEDDHNNEYKIRIEPLLQQSFLRQSTRDGYIWTKYNSDTRYTYYVANPRFATGLLNENSLNYGDAGYSKTDDTGPIIQQTRLNYGKISYKTEEDYLALKAEFLGTKALDCVVDSFVDFLDLYTFGVAGEIKDLWDDTMDVIEHEIDMYEQGKEVTLLADNEKNIFTNLSRQDQYDDPSIKGYSRAAYFMPNEDEELILSEADDSYAEFIVVLNDTNQSSRLVQICDFEIVRRQGNWTSMQYVAGGNEDEAFTFYKERYLFEETFPMDKNTMPYYLLANGTQTFKFTPIIKGGKYFGGIAGYNKQTISQCEFSGSMYYSNRYTDTDYIGGIVGYFESGLVSNCNFSGSITIVEKDWESRSYQPYVGGIAGWRGTNGFLTMNTYPGTVDVENLNPDVSWWAWFKTHHFNQQGNVNELANT